MFKVKQEFTFQILYPLKYEIMKKKTITKQGKTQKKKKNPKVQYLWYEKE